ncbi:GAF domain-containing SpoIIE family protein phosphatase [Streptomyces sp. NPDC085529]|uniref:GAF domain-containing SpoIIE family protein phosphatase n=1 Tax=Streptomyces sp. NPDC085529 TaxID=3365729 RepID=UPI0037CEFA16
MRLSEPTALGRRLLDHLLLEAVRDLGAHAAGVYVLPPGEDVLTLEVMTGLPAEFAQPWQRISLGHPVPVTDAVRSRDLVWVGSQEELARRYPRAALVLPYHFALAGAPVLHGERVMGALLLLWPGPRHDLVPAVRSGIASVCAFLGHTLAAAQQAGQPLTPPAAARTLARRGAGEPTAPGHAASGYAERLPEPGVALGLDGRVTFITGAAARLVGTDGERLLGALPWEALQWLNDPVYEDRYRTAVISRRPTSFIARRPDGMWLRFELFPDDTGISVRITPDPGPGGEATAGASRAEAAVAPAAPARVGALYHLMHLAGALSEAVTAEDVVRLVADTVLPAFGAQALAMLAAEGGRLRIVGYHGYPAETMDRFDGTPLTSPTPGVRALTEGAAGFFASREELERAYPARARREDGMAAWAFLPLIASGKPVGTCVLAFAQPHVFAPEERAALTSLAGLIAQALDRARLYDTEHALAQSLQTNLLPHTLPAVAGLELAARYLPATHGMDIGGDFYDLIRLDAHTVAAVIGDVQGHNMTAAALMGQVRTAIHAHATAGAPPHEVLARTNRLLCDLDPGLFTSCLYARIDLAAHTACLATAGHLPPLLRHPDGATTVVQLEPGLLLGIEADATYPTHTLALPPGAVLALFTDGLVETPDQPLDTRITGLAHDLATGPADLHALADALTTPVRSAADRTDDVALLLLRPVAPHT